MAQIALLWLFLWHATATPSQPSCRELIFEQPTRVLCITPGRGWV